MSSPYEPAAISIPVTVVTTAEGLSQAAEGAYRLTLEPALHAHADGAECVACAARSDIRALLFDILQQARTRAMPLSAVVVDATALADPTPVIARLQPGRVPAFGLRDHTVARSFHLSSVL